MDELKQVIKYSFERNFKRSITHFIFSINDSAVYNKFYENMKLDLHTNIYFKDLKLDEITKTKISEIISLFNSETEYIINTDNIKTNYVLRKKNKNVSIVIKTHGYNSDKVSDFINYGKTKIDSYLKNKLCNNKFSLKLLRNNIDNLYGMRGQNEYNKYSIEYEASKYQIIKYSTPVVQIYGDKCILYGRIILPNSICIILTNRTIIRIFTNRIQLILAKDSDETPAMFNIVFENIINYIESLFVTYSSPYKLSESSIISNYMCDLVYNIPHTIILWLAYKSNIDFLGARTVSIRSIASFLDLNIKIDEINRYLEKIKKYTIV